MKDHIDFPKDAFGYYISSPKYYGGTHVTGVEVKGEVEADLSAQIETRRAIVKTLVGIYGNSSNKEIKLDNNLMEFLLS